MPSEPRKIIFRQRGPGFETSYYPSGHPETHAAGTSASVNRRGEQWRLVVSGVSLRMTQRSDLHQFSLILEQLLTGFPVAGAIWRRGT